MPKIVDHEERRAELCAAVWRLASREGLEAVTVRGVAEEAGWSTGAVVHYFADKEDLLLSAFQTVADRVSRRLETLEARTTEPLELARAWLVETSRKRDGGCSIACSPSPSGCVRRWRRWPACWPAAARRGA